MGIGILGGTFDPVHLGHLLAAESAREALGLERVLFMPAGQPWLKAYRGLTPGRHRLRMVELAVADNPAFQAARHEIDRPGPTYSVDTLEALRAELGPGVPLHLILGQDALAEFHRWRSPERVLELCRLAVVPRPGQEASEWLELFTRNSLPAGQVTLLAPGLTGPQVDISGTGIRRRVAEGRSIRYQVTNPVAEYIREHRLYQSATP
ncbi:MAG: nicotinate-nucleotide adenylyltransferase [Dehalococcoidia bacterium]|nr:nicotinate-nucleotide adenylyltransferase [Dehalococcoidia bacterium]MSQ17794.1 nicotinate-nucleotide adenylyltransferase [Dehalococcoidia bacterium]